MGVQKNSCRLVALAALAIVTVGAGIDDASGATLNKKRGNAPKIDVNKAAAQRIIKSSLIDPTSAKFSFSRSIDATTRDGTKTVLVCGSYNAKNRFGGYVGQKFFAYPVGEGAVYTSDIARYSANGETYSAKDELDRVRGKSLDLLMASEEKFKAVSADVEYWQSQCKD